MVVEAVCVFHPWCGIGFVTGALLVLVLCFGLHRHVFSETGPMSAAQG